MSRVSQVLSAWLVAMLVTVSPLHAQITTGIVAGTIQDAQGGVIPGATVTLISDTRGTRTTPVTSNVSGDFVFPAVQADTYSIEVTMPGFSTLRRAGVVVGSGNRVAVGVLTIAVGGASEVINVTGETPLIQSQSGERSFTIPTESVANLPIANRSFTALAQLAPGVQGTNRIGGGGGNNIMIDGVSAVDTGSNSILLQMNVESIAEVKVLTSGYQAEFGRSSGLQVTAVTKSGTNRFSGSLYDVERNSDWNSNSKTNILNGDAKPVTRQRDWGFSLGGPVGRPGGANKLFFFYSQEFAPRTQGGNVTRYRVPTAAERAGDFSQTFDNNGNPWPYIKDPLIAGTCSAANQTACFQDGGVVGRIPADRFYAPAQAIFNMYPLPNVSWVPGQNYNYEFTSPTETATGWQPAVRLDYQASPALRFTGKYSGWSQSNKVFLGTMPGITESKQYKPVVYTTAFTLNYTLNPTTFLEFTYGHSQNDLAGCGLAQGGTGPTFCTSGVPVGALSNKFDAGLGGLPVLFPSAFNLNRDYYAYEVLSGVQPAMFQNGELQKTPNFTWGGRVATGPPNVPYSGYLNKNATDDVSFSITKVAGNHTFKAGFYNTHSYKAQQQNSAATFGTYNFQNNTANPLDSQFPFSNALLGIVNNYNQASTYIEGSFVYHNTEGYIQDNWKVNSRFTLDYGVRFVRQQPQYDKLGQASNFLPEKWVQGDAPLLYGAGCSTGVTCSGNNRQARHPVSGALLGPGSAVFIGTIVPGTGSSTNGLFVSGQGISHTTYTWPIFAAAPRLGAALDLKGDQSMVLRGGIGLYFDRPTGNTVMPQVQNPPAFENITVHFADLRDVSAEKAVRGAPALQVFQYESNLPSSTQWNTGLQMALPFSTSLDLSYVGQHSWNTPTAMNLNAIDFGAAFLPENQDPTQAVTFLGSNTVANDQMRAFRGFANISQQNPRGWRTFHSLQLSFQRRFTRGLSFGFNDTWTLYDRGQTGARLEHLADGTYRYRADQAEADKLLQSDPVAHTMRANFVWDLPDLRSDSAGMRVLGYLVNDWQLSGVWSGTTGATYAPGFSYQNGGSSVNLTGSPDYGARIRVIGDPGNGCNSGDLLRQFNTAAFAGPLVGSVGLESGPNLLKGCFQQVLDLSIARNIRLGGGRAIQLRVEMFNAPNQAIISGRNATINLSNPNDPITATNLPFDANGNVVDSRSRPRGAGFGVATGFQNARSVQAQIRFSF